MRSGGQGPPRDLNADHDGVLAWQIVQAACRCNASYRSPATLSTTLLRSVMALPKNALPSSARHVLTVLAWHCNEQAVRRGDRQCWPSLNTLAAETSLDRTTCMRAVDLLQERRFVDVERQLRIGNRYRLTDPETWVAGGMAQPAAGSTAQPVSGRAVLPDNVRELLRHFARQVAPRDQPGGMARPEQGFRTSEQERPEERSNRAGDASRPVHRSQAEQIAYVKAMNKGDK